MYETVLYEEDGGVATVSLNRPKRLNAFDAKLHEDLYAAIDGAAADEAVRCIVLRGEGGGSPRAPTWRRSSRAQTESPTSVSTCAPRTAAW